MTEKNLIPATYDLSNSDNVATPTTDKIFIGNVIPVQFFGFKIDMSINLNSIDGSYIAALLELTRSYIEAMVELDKSYAAGMKEFANEKEELILNDNGGQNMTVKFKEFEEGNFKFEPATDHIEYFKKANTNAIRFYMKNEDRFIGYLDMFMNPGKKQTVWRIIEGGTKFKIPTIRKSLDAVEAVQGYIDQEKAEEVARIAVDRHFNSKVPNWKYFARKLIQRPLSESAK